MRIFYVIFLGLCLLIGSAMTEDMQQGPESGVVKTDAGSVLGINESGIWAYLGIPYAAPPVGDLRWRPPAAAKPWTGIREAKEFGPACPQVFMANKGVENMSEDCLNLNVWTPAKSPDEKLPVMVFIHGGVFLRGANANPLYNGSSLARKGVVVVNLNYRLASLGFLSHPELDKESPNNTSGNYGLMDQQAALKWIQDNIDAFGGDPAKVTVFGESAGALSIICHLASPQGKGLYQQAIVESAPSLAKGFLGSLISTRADNERKGVEFAESLGYSGPGAIAQMRNRSVWDLVNATPRSAPTTFQGDKTIHFTPIVDGWFLPEAPEDVFQQGRENPVSLIAGDNADEGLSFISGLNITASEYEQYIRDYFGSNASQVLAKYPASTSEDIPLPIQLAKIITYNDFDVSARLAARSMADLGQNTYLYRFSYYPPLVSGALHAAELL
jgi:para-nitrobenzyl esterase